MTTLKQPYNLSISPFQGQHCETTATGTLLSQLEIKLSEPMLFGLGQGLGFIYWRMKTMPQPFLGGRIKPGQITNNLAKHLPFKIVIHETSSPAKAWLNLETWLNQGRVVGLKLDSYYLEYFTQPIHFAGHYVACYGYNQTHAFLVDTKQQGGLVQTSLSSLANARAAKGPMASKNLSYVFEKDIRSFSLHLAILNAIRANAHDYINPPIQNVGFLGIAKASKHITGWFLNSRNQSAEFKMAAMLMERAGTGGALFRNFYRDFLEESYQLLGTHSLKEGYRQFTIIAHLWTQVSDLFMEIADTGSELALHKASDLLRQLSELEYQAMMLLAKV